MFWAWALKKELVNVSFWSNVNIYQAHLSTEAAIVFCQLQFMPMTAQIKSAGSPCSGGEFLTFGRTVNNVTRKIFKLTDDNLSPPQICVLWWYNLRWGSIYISALKPKSLFYLQDTKGPQLWKVLILSANAARFYIMIITVLIYTQFGIESVGVKGESDAMIWLW